MSFRIFSVFSFIRLSVFGFILRPLIHLDKTSVQGYTYKSLCILLHEDFQFDWYHLSKVLSLFQCVFQFFVFFLKSQVSMVVRNYLWLFNLFLLINLSVNHANTMWFCYYSSIVLFEILNGEISSCSFVAQDCLRCFLFSIWKWELYFQSLQKIVL